MIGVIAESAQQDIIREFFELFKTPWEFYCSNRRYDVVLCSGCGQLDDGAKLTIHYASTELHFNAKQKIQTACQRTRSCILSYRGKRLPIYGDSVTFHNDDSLLLTDLDSGECISFLDGSGEGVTVRVGYDLFSEVRSLLTIGQPAANADMPALELHIAFLRDLIIECGVPLVEIPPVPDGYRFIVCLTHDVDHPSIRQHKWDHTTLGFLSRAVFNSLRNVVRRRLGLRGLLTNWAAALMLPVVQIGLAKDFWRQFGDRYLELEGGVRSTFFVIPFKNRSGTSYQGPTPRFRAARYCAQDITDILQQLITAGCEVGLHGIDAWVDSSQGREEVEEIRRLTGASQIGVRMHWLYYHQQSPTALEKAGAAYDSTLGYNETVGYRAGTTQVFKPLCASWLLELPLHVMDTALFYSAYLGLSREQAKRITDRLADNAVEYGGCLTINWHDRSVAPERLWDGSYRELVKECRTRGAWFATASQVVSWFRERRSVVFETDSTVHEKVRARVTAVHVDHLPGLRLRIHKGRAAGEGDGAPKGYVDIPCDESINTQIVADSSS
jgi:hypothetical protein